MASRIIELAFVESVYEGENNTCCCGCAGEHTTAADDPETVERVVGKVEELLREGAVDLVMPELVSAVEGGTVYIAYFKSKGESNAK